MAHRSEVDLVPLCKAAEHLAAKRHEKPSTVHLLVALASHGSAASNLLDAHRVSAPKLEGLSAALKEDEHASIRHMLQGARELASRTKARTPNSLHLLLALLSERRCAAYRALEHVGADPARLRAATMQVAIGATAPRRLLPAQHPGFAPSQGPAPAVRPAPGVRTEVPAITKTSRAKGPQGVVVNLVPPPRKAKESPVPDRPAVAPNPPYSRASAGLLNATTAHPTPHPNPGGVAYRGQGRTNAANNEKEEKPRQATHRLELDSQAFPFLSTLGKNLTLAVARGESLPVIGREAEVQRCLDVLAKRHSNNPVLVGAPGVGKTSVVRGVAAAMVQALAHSSDDRILLEITLAELLAGTGVRGSLAERWATLRQELRAGAGRIVLVIEDIHQLFQGELESEIGSELRLALAKGELPCVGTSTPEEYRRVIEQDATLARRLCPIVIEEPDREETLKILHSVSSALVSHHRVRYEKAGLEAAFAWSLRYLPGRALPDKALSVLDLAGARARRRGLVEVSLPIVASVVAELAYVPIERILETDAERMLALETIFSESVVGHKDPLKRLATLLRRNAAGIRSSRRPIGTFLLLGPSGVGKTETAKAIAKALFHSSDALTRLDFSEFAEPHSIARLIGAPPGYVGHEAGGQLTEAVRKRPYQVILLDEIEKAHRDVLEGFLQVFDEGRLTDGRGRTVDFTNTVLVLTSNLGASVAVPKADRTIGFRSAQATGESDVDHAAVIAAVRQALPPELYNRIDETLVYAPLSRADLREIARRLLDDLAAALQASRQLPITIDPAVYEALVNAGGYDPELGARPIKRLIAATIEAPLAELILRGSLAAGDAVHVRVTAQGDVCVEQVSKRALHPMICEA